MQRQVKRRKKRRRSKLPILIVILIVVIAAVVLVLTGVIKLPQKETGITNKTAIAYIVNGSSNIIVNSEGVVIDKSATVPDSTPEFTGLNVTTANTDSELVCENQDGLTYLLSVAVNLKQYEIVAREINIDEDYNATVYVNNVKILLGAEDKTAEKIRDLNDFFDQIKDMTGTLHMEEVNDNIGYTFRKEAETTTAVETEVTEETPAAEETTAAETAAEETPAEETAAEEVPVEETAAEEVPVEETEYVEEYTGEEYYEEVPVEENADQPAEGEY